MSRFVSVVDTSCIKLKSISGTYLICGLRISRFLMQLECSNSDASEYFVKLSWLSEYIFRHRQWYPYISSFVTHLHKTSHKSPNKMAKNCIFSKNYQKSATFCFIQTTFFGQDSFKIFVFHIILLDFSSIFGYVESLLNDVEIWFFFFNSHFLIKCSLGFNIFTVSKFHNFG